MKHNSILHSTHLFFSNVYIATFIWPHSPAEIRTPVTGSKARYPWPLDDGAGLLPCPACPVKVVLKVLGVKRFKWPFHAKIALIKRPFCNGKSKRLFLGFSDRAVGGSNPPLPTPGRVAQSGWSTRLINARRRPFFHRQRASEKDI